MVLLRHSWQRADVVVATQVNSNCFVDEVYELLAKFNLPELGKFVRSRGCGIVAISNETCLVSFVFELGPER